MKISVAILLALIIHHVSAQNVISEKPFVLGKTIELHSNILNETRVLNIYLPVGYDAQDSIKYPVIYLLDGSTDEDFIHVAGLLQFNTFPWVDRTPASILIGIANVDRQRDFTFASSIEEEKILYPTTGHSDNFMRFIETELQPFIENNYKTTAVKTIIGESLGGLFATEILLKKPTLFNTYILISPSLWWDNGSLLTLESKTLSKDFSTNTNVYIACGKEGLAPSTIPHVMEVDANLLNEKLMLAKNKNLHVHYDYFPDEDHATIGYQALYTAFRTLYNGSSVFK